MRLDRKYDVKQKPTRETVEISSEGLEALCRIFKIEESDKELALWEVRKRLYKIEKNLQDDFCFPEIVIK